MLNLKMNVLAEDTFYVSCYFLHLKLLHPSICLVCDGFVGKLDESQYLDPNILELDCG